MQQLLLGGAVGSLDSPADGELPPEDRHPFQELALLGRGSRSVRRAGAWVNVWRLVFAEKAAQKTAGAPANLAKARPASSGHFIRGLHLPASLPAPQNELSYISRAACSSCTEFKTKSNKLAEGSC